MNILKILILTLNSSQSLRCDRHCVESCQIRSFFWSVFSHIRTEYGEILRIQSKCGKIRTIKNSVFGHFSRSTFKVAFFCFLYQFSKLYVNGLKYLTSTENLKCNNENQENRRKQSSTRKRTCATASIKVPSLFGNLFMHHVEKWPNIIQQHNSVFTLQDS